jgi:hypothetical protein
LQKSEAVTHKTTTHVTSPPATHKVHITRAPPIDSTNSSGFSKFINDVFQVINIVRKIREFSAPDSKSLTQTVMEASYFPSLLFHTNKPATHQCFWYKDLKKCPNRNYRYICNLADYIIRIYIMILTDYIIHIYIRSSADYIYIYNNNFRRLYYIYIYIIISADYITYIL